ncbi:MAG: hypothetical protein RBG13Loki_3207 [Promethearchaeota archaeon CR_4]|nr:MAG: hypothetical protein RBG13Loki_3207 [Candidatus Lokiarchaeota archaeon CR_4]
MKSRLRFKDKYKPALVLRVCISVASPGDCIECDPFNPAVIPHTIILLILAPIVIITTILLVIKAIQRKKLATYSLLLSFALFLCVILIPLYANIESFILQYRPLWTRWTNPAVYFFLALSVFFFFIFCTDVFLENISKVTFVIYLIWGLAAAIIVALPQNNWGIAGADATFRLISQIHLLVYMLVTFIITCIKAFYFASRSKESLQKKSVRLIGYGSVLVISSLCCTVVDTLLNLLLGEAGAYNLFGTLTWVFATAGMFFFYLGFFPPARNKNIA